MKFAKENYIFSKSADSNYMDKMFIVKKRGGEDLLLCLFWFLIFEKWTGIYL